MWCSNGLGTGGAGTEAAPYQDLLEALRNVPAGGTLHLVGTVRADKRATGETADHTPNPLWLPAGITVTGGSLSYECGSVQLRGDVTLRNMRLELAPHVCLDCSEGEDLGLLGRKQGLTPALFLDGHHLTLDNVDTRLGTNSEQWTRDAPYVSGGCFHADNPGGQSGSHARLTTLNSRHQGNEVTRLSGIYAGGYNHEQTAPLSVDLDEWCLFRPGRALVHGCGTPSADGSTAWPGRGNVDVTLRGQARLTAVDRMQHSGQMSVTLANDAFSATFDPSGADNLTLEEGSTLNLHSLPSSTGHIVGQGGTVGLAATQTLACASLTGALLVNVTSPRAGHIYVSSTARSSASVTLANATNMTLQAEDAGTGTVWRATSNALPSAGTPDRIEFVEPSQRLNVEAGKEYFFTVKVYDAAGEALRPTAEELMYEAYSTQLTYADGSPAVDNNDPYVAWDWQDYDAADATTPLRVMLQYGFGKPLGDLVLRVTHEATGVFAECHIGVETASRGLPATPAVGAQKKTRGVAVDLLGRPAGRQRSTLRVEGGRLAR